MLALFSLLAQRSNVVNSRAFNIARAARYKPFGPHAFCWRKTTDLEFRICCRSEAEASVALRPGSGRKPAGRCKNLFVFHIAHKLRRMLLIKCLATRIEEGEPRNTRKPRKKNVTLTKAQRHKGRRLITGCISSECLSISLNDKQSSAD